MSGHDKSYQFDRGIDKLAFVCDDDKGGTASGLEGRDLVQGLELHSELEARGDHASGYVDFDLVKAGIPEGCEYGSSIRVGVESKEELSGLGASFKRGRPIIQRHLARGGYVINQ